MRTTATSRELFNIEVLHKADDDENTPWTVVPHSKFSILKGVNKLNAKQEFCAITVEHLCYFAVLEDVDLSLLSPHVAARAEQYRNARSVFPDNITGRTANPSSRRYKKVTHLLRNQLN